VAIIVKPNIEKDLVIMENKFSNEMVGTEETLPRKTEEH